MSDSNPVASPLDVKVQMKHICFHSLILIAVIHFFALFRDSLDSLAHIVIPLHPKLKPHSRMLHHFRFLNPLLPKDEDGMTALHYFDSAIQLTRNSARELTEEEFEIGMNAVNQIEKRLRPYYFHEHTLIFVFDTKLERVPLGNVGTGLYYPAHGCLRVICSDLLLIYRRSFLLQELRNLPV
jgi:hypothetical protein